MANLIRGLSKLMARLLVLGLTIAVLGVTALLIVDWQARRADEVRIVEVPYMKPGSDAITTGRIVFVQSDSADDAELLAHELVHVCQWEQQGLSFLWDYTTEYTENLVESGDHETAYIELSFEQEARLGEVDCDLGSYLPTTTTLP
jgi:hypothetical protein